MNRFEVHNTELSLLQHTVNIRSEFELGEFAFQANKYLEDLRNINVNGGNLSVGFLIRPSEQPRIQSPKGVTAQINEKGLMILGLCSPPLRNHYKILFGFESVNVKEGWYMGLRFAGYQEPVNTYFLSHIVKVDILAHVRHDDGSNVSLSPYKVRMLGDEN